MIVYKITNKINNKFYIGITTKSLKQRFNGHIKQPRFYLGEAIKKYGKENFKIKKIDTANSFKVLKQKEKYYINKFKPEYNLTDGGDGTYGYKHKKKFIQFRRKIMKGNKIRKGIFFTKEQRQKISDSLKGHSKTNFGGYKLSADFKEKARLRWLGDKNIAKRPDVREKLRLAALKREARKRELKKII